MTLSPRARIIVYSLIGLMVVAAILMVLASFLNTHFSEKEDKFDQTIKMFEAGGLTASALVPEDLYGKKYTRAYIVCPGDTRESVAKKLGLDATLLPLPEEGVPENQNYFLVGANDDTFQSSQLDRNEVDLCTGLERLPFSTKQMIPLAKDIDGVWKLAA